MLTIITEHTIEVFKKDAALRSGSKIAGSSPSRAGADAIDAVNTYREEEGREWVLCFILVLSIIDILFNEMS